MLQLLYDHINSTTQFTFYLFILFTARRMLSASLFHYFLALVGFFWLDLLSHGHSICCCLRSWCAATLSSKLGFVSVVPLLAICPWVFQSFISCGAVALHIHALTEGLALGVAAPKAYGCCSDWSHNGSCLWWSYDSNFQVLEM